MSCETTEYGSLQSVSTIPPLTEIILVENGVPRRMSATTFAQLLGADKHYEHAQATAAVVWTIAHNLDKKPTPTIIDSTGDVVECDLAYPTNNSITLTFSNPTAGICYLN